MGERPGANAENIAAVVNEAAGGFDGILRAWMPDDVLHRVSPVLDVPCHMNARIGPRHTGSQGSTSTQSEQSSLAGSQRLLAAAAGCPTIGP